jgi:1-acyl-sn-glycerol-3-phosphate acyltransferase
MTSDDAAAIVAKQPSYAAARRFWRCVIVSLMPLMARVTVTGRENVPDSGPTILMINHISFVDPIVVTGLIRRPVISLAKKELLDNPITALVIRTYGLITVDRGEVDRRALDTVIALIRGGYLILIAPEGTRRPEGLARPHDGLAYVAHKTDAVIVPVSIYGAEDYLARWKRFRPAHIGVHFGQPFRFTLPPDVRRLDRAAREAMMDEAMYLIAQGIPESHAEKRGVYHDLSNATTRFLEFTQVPRST